MGLVTFFVNWLTKNGNPGYRMFRQRPYLHSVDITPEAIATIANPIFEKYGIERAILFGSIARGTYGKRSDVDLILIQRTEKRFLDRYEGILGELQQAIRGRDVEVFIDTPEEFQAIIHRPFIRKALAEGKVIYESGKGPA